MNTYLTDLDELVLMCKDPEARKYIAEAIACYKAGAFRACIVTTWIAVVYDFVNKLRELERLGDKDATPKLQEFQKAHSEHRHIAAVKFEKKILDWAREPFEFITSKECDDLKRLAEDRNRCAHPSMISEEEIYEPSAELARYHLKNAVTYFLQHPPVQGKKALTRLESTIDSPYFPLELETAIAFLKDGPMANPRSSLIRNLVIVLLKHMLKEAKDIQRYKRLATATNALRHMHRENTERTIAEILPKLLAEEPNRPVPSVIQFLKEIDDTWQYLSESLQITINYYIENAPELEIVGIYTAVLDIKELRKTARKRFTTFSINSIETLINVNPRYDYVDHAIVLYGESASSNVADSRARKIVMPLIGLMNEDDFDRIIRYGVDNTQICSSSEFPRILRTIRQIVKIDFDNLVNKHGIPKNLIELAYSNSDLDVDINEDSSSDSHDWNSIPF